MSEKQDGLSAYDLLVRDGQNINSKTKDWVAEEVAVAMVYNGISHAVMMATPVDLEDFAYGFSLTEGIIDSAEQLRSIELLETPLGWKIEMDIASRQFMQLKYRRRQLTGRTSCGLCGMESLESVMPDLPKVPAARLPEPGVIEKVLTEFEEQQLMRSLCGGTHAAAIANSEGDILVQREDVGRHNALDKVLGCLARSKISNTGNLFVVVSSRASYEMITKIASQSLSTLVAVSAPTSLAIELSIKADINLVGFARPGRQNIYNAQTTKVSPL